MPHPFHVIVIEDTEEHHDMIMTFVNLACESLDPPASISRMWTKQEVEAALALEQDRAHLLIVFDLQMELSSGPSRLDSLVMSLWNEPRNTWRGRVPIVVFSAFPDKFERLSARRYFHVVRKIPRGDEDILEKLQTAIESSITELIAREGRGEC